MKLVLFVALLAACDDSSQSSPLDGMPTSDTSTCQVGADVTGSFGGGGPFHESPHMFGAITKVETWDTDTGGIAAQHLAISDGDAELRITVDGTTEYAIVQYVGGGSGDGDFPPEGTGSFARSGTSCITGTFAATLDRGDLSGTYTGIDLGLNPTRP